MTVAVLNPHIPSSVTDVGRRSKKSIKLVTCIIRTEKLSVVTESVNKLNLVGGMTVSEARGLGHDEKLFHGPKYSMTYVPKVKVELVIEADDVVEVERLVAELARTGEVGDGKIYIVSVVDALRIRTGERGTAAL